jgi:hypothetical protein
MVNSELSEPEPRRFADLEKQVCATAILAVELTPHPARDG